jgi:hypothetical protein
MNMGLPLAQQITLSHLNHTSFCHMDAGDKLALLHFWDKHRHSAKKQGTDTKIPLYILNALSNMTYNR